MRCVMVMFDSLNRHMLSPYGCDWTRTPNFQRLAQRTVTFDKSYVCSMPCMPARRDLHTGRPNFLYRGWGPLEPFDDSMPQMLGQAGISSHLISDHYHYWEAGGATYHTQYNTWQFFRGQEGDPWMGQVAAPPVGNAIGRNAVPSSGRLQQDRVNRQFIRNEADWPQYKTFEAGIDFIQRNHQDDNWFLQIETFDPHEPFYAHRNYKDRYPEHYANYRGPLHDWPDYAKVKETPEQVEHMRYEYASLLSMCDSKLGDVLDTFDALDLWKDTMLIVWTDHGFLLGEQDCWAKCWAPFYEEVAHTPFFVWDPRSGKRGERRSSLVQPSIDLGPTILDFFNQQPTERMTGRVLRETIAEDKPVREAAMFGIFGGQVNITDGRYAYMRGPARENNGPLYDYTLMPTRMAGSFKPEEFANVELAEPFSFTRGCKLLKIDRSNHDPKHEGTVLDRHSTRLYDLESDPRQCTPITDTAVEERLCAMMVELMQKVNAPAEQYERLGLAEVTSGT